MKKARAMYIPAGGKKAVWGPVDQNVLPEGYPYKEGSKTEIVWDGNTDGLVSVGGLYYKVSDAILDNETIKNGYLYGYFGGNGISELALASFWDRMNVTDEFVVAGEYAIFVRANNAEIDEMTFPEAGVYFVCVNGFYGTKFVSETETIHPMAPEFLPALTSPNGTKYQLTVADDGTLSAVAVS